MSNVVLPSFCTTVETFSINIEGFFDISIRVGSFSKFPSSSPSTASVSPSEITITGLPFGSLPVAVAVLIILPLSAASCSII